MAKVTHFFLGANSGRGFCSLFPQLIGREDTRDLMILKGAPGAGKSAFLRSIGEAMEAEGLDVEYLHCAAAPEELDGVLLPQLRCGAVDGTAPHLLEPQYPLAVERIVDLGRFCDVTAAKTCRKEIREDLRACAEADLRASRCFRAARQLERSAEAEAAEGVDAERLRRRFEGIRQRELRRRGGEEGKASCRFLGGPTCEGTVWRFDSVERLCPRIYALLDRYGLAAPHLRQLKAAAAESGWDCILCLSPEEPERIEHLLIPGLGLAFVTSRPGMEYPGKTWRRLHLDALTHPENRAPLRFSARMARELRREGESALREAHIARARLEERYRPYVDTDGVRALAAMEAGRLLSWRSAD